MGKILVICSAVPRWKYWKKINWWKLSFSDSRPMHRGRRYFNNSRRTATRHLQIQPPPLQSPPLVGRGYPSPHPIYFPRRPRLDPRAFSAGPPKLCTPRKISGYVRHWSGCMVPSWKDGELMSGKTKISNCWYIHRKMTYRPSYVTVVHMYSQSEDGIN